MTAPLSVQDAAEKGYEWFRMPNAPEFKELVGSFNCFPSSEIADALLIGAWVGYHRGVCPHVHKSRGHSWKVTVNGMAQYVKVQNWQDHRDGVVEMVGKL